MDFILRSSDCKEWKPRVVEMVQAWRSAVSFGSSLLETELQMDVEAVAITPIL